MDIRMHCFVMPTNQGIFLLTKRSYASTLGDDLCVGKTPLAAKVLWQKVLHEAQTRPAVAAVGEAVAGGRGRGGRGRVGHFAIGWAPRLVLDHRYDRDIQVENVDGALVGSNAEPCRFIVEGDRVDFGPVHAASQLVEEGAGGCTKHADQRAFITRRRAFRSVAVESETAQTPRMGSDDTHIRGGWRRLRVPRPGLVFGPPERGEVDHLHMASLSAGDDQHCRRLSR